jgi:hypothetical protein
MKHPSPGATGDEKVVSENANNAEEPAGSALTWWSSAIDRQMAAASALGYGNSTQEESLGPASDRSETDSSINSRKPYRFGWGSYLLLILLIAVAAALVYIGFNRPELPATIVHNLQRAINYSPANNSPSSSTANSSAKTQTSINANSPINPHASTTDASMSANSALTNAAAVNGKSSPGGDAQTFKPQKIIDAAAPDAIEIPIADVSLQNRPEFLEQLVQIYRSRLANNPSDVAALGALSQLQERSLSDLENIIGQGDDAMIVKSLATLSRIFPELADNTRYKYLVARIDYAQRGQKTETAAQAASAAHAEQSATATAPVADSAAAATNSSSKNISAALSPAKTATPAISAATAKKADANPVSTKPEIRSVSITPGTMVNDHFVPGDGGNVFMVELSYRNFAKAFIEQTDATLVTRLGVPGDPMVLAEAPVTISADRGTKNFLIETTSLQGYAGGKFKLNFILNDEFLTSRTVTLSLPRQ